MFNTNCSKIYKILYIIAVYVQTNKQTPTFADILSSVCELRSIFQ